jgi:uncharacterized protein YdeI (BOF family)
MSTFETSSPAARRIKLGLAAIGLLAVGGFAGGAVSHEFRPPIEMAPTHVVAIRNLATSQGIVTIRGRVAESFGDRWVVDDGTGRTLVDGGSHNRDTSVSPGAVISVQGRFDRETFHPSFLIDASGTVTPLGPPPGHNGPHGHPGPDGEDMHGPDEAPPPTSKPSAPATAE